MERSSSGDRGRGQNPSQGRSTGGSSSPPTTQAKIEKKLRRWTTDLCHGDTDEKNKAISIVHSMSLNPAYMNWLAREITTLQETAASLKVLARFEQCKSPEQLKALFEPQSDNVRKLCQFWIKRNSEIVQRAKSAPGPMPPENPQRCSSPTMNRQSRSSSPSTATSSRPPTPLNRGREELGSLSPKSDVPRGAARSHPSLPPRPPRPPPPQQGQSQLGHSQQGHSQQGKPQSPERK